ncbi:MAG TPA: TerC family protein [Candidatus Angelobacter sp.]|nr:TerC family protein [Candidatus Angelobacter sp.]
MLTFWIVFNVAIVILLFVDLAVINRGGRVLTLKQALLSSAVWIALALAFAVFIHQWLGAGKALEFVTGYLVEESLSVDNLFVFIVLFRYFKVPAEQERTVLFWGILGALVMRGVFILTGVALVKRFHWIIYAFGAFLVYSGFGLLREGDDETVDPSRNVVLRMARKFLRVIDTYEGKRFFVVREGKKFATPLLIVLLVVETTDILFATDSIPAILAITRDAFIVYTSNVFAILGLRSMFFALARLMKLFHYLNYGLAIVLMFVGVKMLLSIHYEIATWVALVVIAGVLAVSVVASVLRPEKEIGKGEESARLPAPPD